MSYESLAFDGLTFFAEADHQEDEEIFHRLMRKAEFMARLAQAAAMKELADAVREREVL